jgi:hypothetical protein
MFTIKNIFQLVLSLMLLFFFNSTIQAQGGSLLELSYKMETIQTDEEIYLAKEEYQGVSLGYSFAPSGNFSAGFELHKSIDQEVNFFDGRFKLGMTINNKKRLQFPIFPFLGMFSLKQDEAPRLSGLVYGIKGGLRLYITDLLAVQGMYSVTRYGITKEGDNDLGDPYPMINANSISAGIVYYIKDK